jgi:hypothetical protein
LSTLPSPAFAATIRPWAQQSGLVGYWSFNKDDVTDKVYDRSGLENNGYLTSSSRATSTLKILGKLGQALDFNGSTDAVSLGNPTSLQITGSISLSAWAKSDGIVDDDIISKGAFTGGGWSYLLNANTDLTDRHFACLISSNSVSAIRYSGIIPDNNTWYHVACVFNAVGQTLDIYVNGALDNGTLAGTIPNSLRNTTDTAEIGWRLSDGNMWDGSLDEIRVYNRTLSSGEVKALYKTTGQSKSSRTSTAVKSGLVGWWPLDGNNGTNPASFGETNVLGGDDGNNGNYLLAQAATATYNTVVSSMSFYVNTAVGDLRLGIYDDNGPNDGPGDKLAETNSFTPTTGWNTVPLIATTTIPAGRYWIAHLPSTNSLRYPKHGTVGKYCYYSYTFGTMPATFDVAPTCGTDHWSVYASGLATGIGMDKSGNANSVAQVTGLTPVAGKVGQGLNFDGTDDCAVGDPSASLNNLSALTVTGWIYPQYYDIFGPHGYIIQKGHSSSPPSGITHYAGWDLSFQPGNPTSPEFGVDYATNNLYRRAADYIFTLDEWQYITVTWDGTTNATGIRMYRNGVEISYNESQDGSGARTPDETYGIRLGCNTALDSIYKGSMDDMRVYNRVLTEAEIKQLYNEGVGTTLAKNQASRMNNGLVGYWSFNGPDFTHRVYDRSGTGNHGDIVAGATTSVKAPGKVGQGLRVVTGGAYATLQQAFGPPQRTISAWIYPLTTGGGGFGQILSQYVGGGSWSFSLCDTNASECPSTARTLEYYQGFSNTNGIWYSSADAIKLNEWNHVVVTYDRTSTANVPILYIDGRPATVNTASTPIGTADDGSGGLRVGVFYGSEESFKFNGTIDEVRLYDRILSADEVKQLYNIGR